MKIISISINSIALIILVALTNIGYSQAIYKIQDSQEIRMKLKGTSTLHDWEMNASKATGEAQFLFNLEKDSELTSIKSLMFTIAVKDLKSDNKGLDKNAYKALKTEEYKKIHYKLSTSTLFPEKEGYLLKSNGKLTIAGCTKDIEMPIHIVVNQDNSITCKGAYELKMTDYNVEPPSFMMGLMKTGDATTLDFSVTYKN